MTKLGAFADVKINIAKAAISLYDRVRNTVGKGEHFLLFQQCFQKASFTESLKVAVVWYRVTWQVY